MGFSISISWRVLLGRSREEIALRINFGSKESFELLEAALRDYRALASRKDLEISGDLRNWSVEDLFELASCREVILALCSLTENPVLAEELIREDPPRKFGYIGDWMLADIAQEKGDLKTAYAYFDYLADRMYKVNLCHYRMGQICVINGDHQLAQEHFKKANRFDGLLQERVRMDRMEAVPFVQSDE